LSDPAINDIITMNRRDGDEGNQFTRLASALRPWRNKAAHETSIGDPALSSWLLAASMLAESLADAFELPTGAERLAAFGVLEEQINDLDDLKVEVDESLHERLWTLAESFKQTLANVRQRILEDTPIAAVLDSAFVDANMEAEIVVRFKNEGNLPLRNLTIYTMPDQSETKAKLLRASAELTCTVPVPPRPAGSYPLNIKWKALRLDSKLIEGTIMLDYSTRTHVGFPMHGIGTNPYIVGGPLKSSDAQEMFFGREDIIDQVRRSLRMSGSSTVLLLEGNRRAGKTSILYRMQAPGVLTGWIPVYWTTQRATGHKSAAGLVDKEIFYNIAHELVLAVQAAGYVVDVPGLGEVLLEMTRSELREQLRTKMRAEFDLGSPLELLDLLLESINTAVTDRRILLILDEFDKIQEGIESGVTSPQVPENLRALFHRHDHLSGILTGSRRIKHLRQNHWSALYGIGVPVTVDALDVESARRLVVEPVEGRLVYATNAREQVLDLTSCQPFLIQALCYRVFEECANSGEQSVTLKTVEQAAQEMVLDNEHFRTLFDFIGTERRRYLACVANRLSEGPDRVSFDLIAEELDKDQIEYDTAALADDLQYLQELDVLDLEQHELGTSYRIKIPLFSRWLERNEHDRMRRQLAAKE
jgi:type I restriction enzyme M protein